MKHIHVVAAVIIKETNNGPMVFATQRGYGEFKDGWEFPGGKVETGETNQQALQREIQEELDTRIFVEDHIDTIEYDYPTFHLCMDCYFAKVESGSLLLKEHESAKWLSKENLYSVDWLPADQLILKQIEQRLEASR